MTAPSNRPANALAQPEESPLQRPRYLRMPTGAPPQSPDVVPARMLNELMYCERLMYLEWVQGEFADNVFTVDGRAVHRRADKPGRPLRRARAKKATEDTSENADEAGGTSAESADAAPKATATEDRPYQSRSVWLSSTSLGITAKIDVVDVEGNRVMPIEYKRGKRPSIEEGAYLPERVQLCAQVLLLRDHDFHCDEAAIYYAEDHQRVSIAITEDLVQRTLGAVDRARDVASGPLPPPLEDNPKCHGCSLVGICLPDEVSMLRSVHGHEPAAPRVEDEPWYHPDLYEPLEEDPAGLGVPGQGLPLPVRRLHPARDDRLPVVVQEQGAQIAISGERLLIRRPSERAVEARLPNTSQVCLFGNVQLTIQALRTLMDRGIPVSFFSYGGFFVGRTVGHDSKNVSLRLAQYAGVTNSEVCLRVARGLVVSKILNCRTLLRRNTRDGAAVALGELKQLARKADEMDSLESLLGIEGTAARAYFGAFTTMLRDQDGVREAFDLDGRNRRPPRDPVNALLSFCYSLLTKEFTIVLGAVGLDPMLGFYHQPHFGRPALALDLMEEFRPLIADSVVVSVINNGEVQGDDFVSAAGAVALKQAARKRLILAFERRMDHLVTHPVFGYRISYRRVLEVQARLLGRMLLGELDSYPAFRTR